MNLIREVFIILFISFLAIACGSSGGGGNGNGGDTVPDTTPPTVTSTSPADGATDVAVESDITATFSEQMDANTINTTTFTINGVTGIVAYDQGSRTAIFSPSENLDFGFPYTATVTTGAQDSAGNRLASDHTWSFTTAPALGVEDGIGLGTGTGVPTGTGTATISGRVSGETSTLPLQDAMVKVFYSSDADPSNTSVLTGADGRYILTVTENVDLSLQFSAAGFATINSQRGQIVGNVEGADISMSTTGEAQMIIDEAFAGPLYTAFGWVLVNTEDSDGSELLGVTIFASGSPAVGTPSRNPVYVNCDLLPTPLGATVGDNNNEMSGFINPCIDDRPFMYAVAYGPPSTQNVTISTSFDSAIATVRTGEFTIVDLERGGNGGDTVPDTTPPTVTSTSPVDLATDVSVNTAITATFSEEMNANTIDTSSFTVQRGTFGPVTISGTVDYDQVSRTATFTPLEFLNYGSLDPYKVTITTGAYDNAGNSLVSDHTWSFNTAQITDSTWILVAPDSNTFPGGTQATLNFSLVAQKEGLIVTLKDDDLGTITGEYSTSAVQLLANFTYFDMDVEDNVKVSLVTEISVDGKTMSGTWTAVSDRNNNPVDSFQFTATKQ